MGLALAALHSRFSGAVSLCSAVTDLCVPWHSAMERDMKLHDQIESAPRTHLSREAVKELKGCTKIGWLHKRGTTPSACNFRGF